MSSDDKEGSVPPKDQTDAESESGGEDHAPAHEDASVEVSGDEPPTADASDDAPSADADVPTIDADTNDADDLAAGLLHSPISQDDEPRRRWAYAPWLRLIVSVFVLYHGVILLVHNLPSKGLARGLQKKINADIKIWPRADEKPRADGKKPLRTFGLDADAYWRATGNTQSWAMFAPNPHRSNIFMKVLVKDRDGEIWDLKHDIYGKRSYPYLWYDRMGKINRRIVDQKGYRRYYAAWVCRQWERDHEGEPADEVQFIKMWTRIPSPRQVFERAKGNIFRMGYDPNDLHLYQREEDTVRCRTTRNAQLPNHLRERYGLEPTDEKRVLETHNRTWWDQQESKAKKEALEAKRAERRAAREAKRETKEAGQ